MQHVMFDGFQGFRSRFDNFGLVHEVLDELPISLGLQPVMPPFLLPYYNGVIPEDCGISSFVFLAGGHFTIHTFSYRESVFADIVNPALFDEAEFSKAMNMSFPCKKTELQSVKRITANASINQVNPEQDFGPHLFLDFEDYQGPCAFEGLFNLFDTLPSKIGMTPIMRPYVMTSRMPDGRLVISAMTMIAESHISMHIFPEERRAAFDLFSCSFFDVDSVTSVLLKDLKGTVVNNALSSRGRDYRIRRTESSAEVTRSRIWLSGIP